MPLRARSARSASSMPSSNAIAIAEIELAISLQVLLRAVLVDALHAAFENRVKAFHGVGMDNRRVGDVLAAAVGYGFMLAEVCLSTSLYWPAFVAHNRAYSFACWRGGSASGSSMVVPSTWKHRAAARTRSIKVSTTCGLWALKEASFGCALLLCRIQSHRSQLSCLHRPWVSTPTTRHGLSDADGS